MESASVVLHLPAGLVARVEEASRARGQSRDDFMHEAIESYLAMETRRQHFQADAEAYARGYEMLPETADEIARADALGAAVLAMEPWD